MRSFLLIAPALWVSATVYATSFAGFTGGRGDGSAHAEYILPKQPSLASHFLGGRQDGYASGGWRGYQPSVLPALARFAGGRRDGYASGGWQGYQPSVLPALARFAGGMRDGYASTRFFSSWLQNPLRRFRGGGFDGYASSSILDVPDNWTLFGIESMTAEGPTQKISAYGVPGSFYTLQRSTNLPSGWVNVPNQIRISPTSPGILELEDNYTGNRAFYRILMEK